MGCRQEQSENITFAHNDQLGVHNIQRNKGWQKARITPVLLKVSGYCAV